MFTYLSEGVPNNKRCRIFRRNTVDGGPSSSTGVVVCAGGDGAGECVAGGATALGGTCALPHRLWHCTAGTARLCSVCHGDSVETAPQDL